MTPAEQQQRFGEVVHLKVNRCSRPKCREVSSVKTMAGDHLCINHYLNEVELAVSKK